MPKISIIIPVYNVEQYLRQSLDSVIKQTLKDIEIICVDDCSTDGSLNILKEYAAKDNRIKILEQKLNQGQGVARNLALDVAKGAYVMFLDPDDWFELDACEVAYNQINKANTDITFFYFKYHKESNDTIIIKKSKYIDVSDDEIEHNCFKLNDCKNLKIKSAAIWCQIYNRDFLNNANCRFSDTRTCEDNPFFFAALSNAGNVSLIEKHLYNYRLRDNSITPYYIKHWEQVLYNKDLSYKLIENSKNSEQILKLYAPYYWNSTVLGHWDRVLKFYPEFKNIIYENMHSLAKKLNTFYNMSEYYKDLNLYRFNLHLNGKNKKMYRVWKLIYSLFSVFRTRERLVIRFLGFKLNFRSNDERN